MSSGIAYFLWQLPIETPYFLKQLKKVRQSMNKSFQKSENRQAEHDPRRKGNKLGEPCHSFSLLHVGVFRS